MSNGISITKRRKVFEKTNGRCWYCGIRLGFQGEDLPEMMTIDHVIPNRDNNINNLVASCISCNMYKGKGSIESLRKRMAGVPKFESDHIGWIKDNFGIDITVGDAFSGKCYVFYGETL